MPPSVALRTARRGAGLCPLDGQPAAPFTFCARHRARKVKHVKLEKSRRQQAMVCRDCPILVLPHEIRCSDCRTVQAVKDAGRYEARAEAGVCVLGCGRKAPSTKVCKRCLKRKRHHHAKEQEDG